VEGGEWRVESGEWKVESGKWRVESGEGKVESCTVLNNVDFYITESKRKSGQD